MAEGNLYSQLQDEHELKLSWKQKTFQSDSLENKFGHNAWRPQY